MTSKDLIDEGRVIDLTDYQRALKVYSDWVEKCAVRMGRVDNQMRRFGLETTYRHDFEESTSNKPGPSLGKKHERFEREILRSEISLALNALARTKALVRIDTRPTIEDIFRIPLPGTTSLFLL